MAPKPQGRPKAAHIPDSEILLACRDLFAIPEGLPHYHPKVVLAKVEKLRKRGLIDAGHRLTKSGRVALEEAGL